MSRPGRHARPRILFLALEFHDWKNLARHVSYTSSLGIEEGLRAQGVEFYTIPTPWFKKARELCRGRKFDQVWIEVARYEHFTDDWLAWMATLAPVRLGFMVESRTYLPEERELLALNPGFFTEITQRIERRFPYLTHVAAVDELDAHEISEQFMPAMWWPQTVPERFIVDYPAPPVERKAVFSGSLYGARPGLIAESKMQKVLVQYFSSERRTLYPYVFNGLHRARGMLPFPLYLAILRWYRRTCFKRWLRSMQYGCAVVNFPSHVKAYGGRVVEAMAAGRPVISWRVPDRPRTEALFADGREILLFDKDQPEQMAEHARRLIEDEAFNRRMVEQARARLRRFHTMEYRVGQILDWLDTGAAPDFGEGT